MPRAPLTAVLAVAWLATAARGHAPDAAPADVPHPVYSTDERWVRPALAGVGALFAAAFFIGGGVWLRRRDVVPTAASHEEDPAADRH